MKRLLPLLFSVLFILFLFPSFVLALSPTPSMSPSISSTEAPTQSAKEQSLGQQIEAIKEKIATSVSKLHLVDNRGIIGSVTESTSTALSLTDIQGNIRFVDVDQLTNFASPSASANFGISDLSKGTWISVIGKYNKDTKRLLARFINVVTVPKYISGVVTTVDRVNFTMTVIGEDKTPELVDINSVTKTYTYDADANETKTGFSKVQEGQRVMVVGYANVKEKNRLSATRVLLFPLLPPNPNIHVSIQVTPTSLTPTLGPVRKTVTPTP